MREFPGSNACISELAYTYAGIGEFEKAEMFYAQVVDTLDREERIPLKFAHRLAYVYWNRNRKERAMEYFNAQLKYCEESLMEGEGYQTAEYDLAAVHAFLGNTNEALDYLEKYSIKGFTYGLHDYILRDPLFAGLKGDNRFLTIVRNVQQQKAELRADLIARYWKR
jgi:tetratricopeptide (TPR) repeat protein